MNKYFCRC